MHGHMKTFHNFFGAIPWLAVCLFGLLLAACGGNSVPVVAAAKPSVATTPSPVQPVVPVLVAVAVSPPQATIPTAAVQPFTAVARYSDGSVRDVTASARWASASETIASVAGSPGLATGVASGTSDISASLAGISGSATLTVTPATLVSVVVTPAKAMLQMGISQGLLASALFTDGSVWDVTNTAVWSSHAPLVAAVVAGTGVTTGVSAGTARVTAAFGGKTTVATVKVPVAKLVSIAVTPAVAQVQPGDTRLFVATGTYSDGSSAKLGGAAVWSSTTQQVAQVVPTSGLASALHGGSSLITATSSGKSATATLTVSAAAAPGAATR